MSTIKNYISVVLVLGLTAIPLAAQRRTQRGLTTSQLSAVVSTNLNTCNQKEPVVSRFNARAISTESKMEGNKQAISMDRIERTLNGVWRGSVRGNNFSKKLLARDGFVNVDYYLVVDIKRGEALVFEQFGSGRAAPRAKPGAPTWSYVFCGKENYSPRHQPAQVHQFVKVSDNVEDARTLLGTSTAMAFEAKNEVVLSDIWQRLVETKYFDDSSRSLAFAGALFKPFKIGNVPSKEGGSLLEMDMRAEYRGSGQTAAKFTPGEPIRGVEKGQFVGVSSATGDFLVSSLKNGLPVKKSSDPGWDIDMFFDKVVIGPLAQ